MCSQKGVGRRLTATGHQYLPVRHNCDCAHCIDEETEVEGPLPKVMQLVSGGVEIQSRVHMAPKPVPFPVYCEIELHFFFADFLYSKMSVF